MQCCSFCPRLIGLGLAGLLAGCVLLTVSCEKKSASDDSSGDLYVVEGDDAHDEHAGHDHGPGEGHDDESSSSTDQDDDDNGGDSNADAPANTQQIAFDGLTAPVPNAWESQTPNNEMRAVQMRVPGEGDAGDASFVAFSSIGGSVNQNISRWIGQFTSDDDRHLEPAIEELKVGDLDVTIVTISGNYDGGNMSPDDTGDNRTMIQAIVVQPFGDQTFLRLLGPTATVEANRAAFQQMIDEMQ